MLTIIFLVSCSNDSNVAESVKESHSTTLKSGGGLSTADYDLAVKTYEDIIASAEYADLKSSIQAFNSKIGNRRISFTTKQDWMDWITLNIRTTTFTDINEFETMFDDSVNKMTIVVTTYSDFYTLILDADAAQLHGIFKPLPDPSQIPPQQTNNCEDQCYDTSDAAIDYAYDVYYSQLQLAARTAVFDANFVLVWAINQQLDNEMSCITYELNMCLSYC